MDWATNLNKQWYDKTTERAKALISKVESGKDLTSDELNELGRYLVDNPKSKLYDRGMKAFLRSLKLEVEGGEDVSYVMDISGGVTVTIQSTRTMSLEKQYIKTRKITIDSAGNVKVGNKLLYNKKTGKVYNANQSNAKHGRFAAKTPESVKYQIEVGHDIDTMTTSIGKFRNLDDATAALKANFTSSLKFWDDFDWSAKNISNIGKFGKVAKGIGLVGTLFEAGTNVKENFIDDKTSSTGDKVRNFAVDQGVDLVTSTGAAATGAAIGGFFGTLIPIPGVGTAIGVAIGIGIGMAIDNLKFKDLGNKSISDSIKDNLIGSFEGEKVTDDE